MTPEDFDFDRSGLCCATVSNDSGARFVCQPKVDHGSGARQGDSHPAFGRICHVATVVFGVVNANCMHQKSIKAARRSLAQRTNGPGSP